MGEVLAFTASVIAIVQIADRIVDICKFYIESVKDSPSDLRLILIEISALKTVLENVEFLALCPSEESTILGTFSGQENPIEGCRKSIADLENLFPSDIQKDDGPNATKKRKFNAMLAALAWPLKEKKARKLLDEILRYKSTITVALTTDNTRDIKKIKTQTSDIHNILTESQRYEVLKWLQHTDPSSFHHQAQKNFEPETGDWVLRMPEWNDWLESKQRCLWLHGIPGAGKTVLISSLVEQTQKYCQQRQTKKFACIYYYFYFGHNRDETVPCLLWLLNQLCRQADFVSEDIYRMYKSGLQPNITELLKAVTGLLNKFEKTYIIVDAIDESNPREDLLKVLRDFVTDPQFRKIQILASSREYIDIETTMEPISMSISMANPFVEEDIKKHVGSVLQSNPKFRRWSPELLLEVEDAVSKGAKGMFRWAVCQIDALKRLRGDMVVVREALANLPKDLDETYDRVLQLVPEEEQVFVQHALQWIRLYGEAYNGETFPCSLLLQAIAKSTSDVGISLNARYYDVEVLQELCGCLVKVSFGERINYRFTASWRVSFAHFTVQEYLDSVRKSNSSSAFSVACKENLWQSFTTMVFKEALDVRWKGLWMIDIDRPSERVLMEALENDIVIFWVVFAFLSLKLKHTHQHEHLRTLAQDFLNPSMPHNRHMKPVLFELENLLEYFLDKKMYPTALWEDTWDLNASNSDAIYLFDLLKIIDESDQVWLLGNYFEGGSAKSVLQARVKLKHRIDPTYSFDGPFINLLMGYGLVEGPLRPLLLDYSKAFSDISALLFDYIGWHDPGEHKITSKGRCFVEQLLDAGADPDGSGYYVTTLQVAVQVADIYAVEALLKAGANPNFTGKKGKPFTSRFDGLRGKSPLRICTQNESVLEADDFHDPYNPSRRLRQCWVIEAILLKYGAEDFHKDDAQDTGCD